MLVHIWRGDFRCKLDSRLVDIPHIRLLLGRKACFGMKIVSYLDNDEINPLKPATRKETVYTLNDTSPVSTE